MTVKITKDGIESSSNLNILDFTIDTSGIQLFTANCKIAESKQATYNITNCTTTDCTTVDCTTVKCTTVKCTTIDCTTVQCNTVDCNQCTTCNSADSYCSTDS